MDNHCNLPTTDNNTQCATDKNAIRASFDAVRARAAHETACKTALEAQRPQPSSSGVPASTAPARAADAAPDDAIKQANYGKGRMCLFVTLGCAKNQVDTDRMRALLLASGFREAHNADDADVVLINTCSFLASATSESIDVTLDLAQEQQNGITTCPIIMCGCVPSRYGKALTGELPEVAAFVKANDEDGIIGVVCDVLGLEHPSFSFVEELSRRALRTKEATSAFVKISEGCSRMCAFCAIPNIRGPYASRSPQDILAEVDMLVDAGIHEIILIGQDTGIWGSDFKEPKTLAWLLQQVAHHVRGKQCWIRVLYLQPEGMTPELISTIRDTPEVLPYIDIPIQHCSERVLSRMGRTGSAQELHELFATLRREIPNMVLRTTGMVGFPGETAQEADELVDFFKAEEFDYMSVFSYSQEDGTTAARMRDQVSAQTKLERTQRLRDVAEELGFSATAKHVGEVVDVIIDSKDYNDDGSYELIGHAWFQAPDCDGAVHLPADAGEIGDVVRVRLVSSYCYELSATLLGSDDANHAHINTNE